MAKKDLDALLSDSDSDEETPVVIKSSKKQKKEKDSDEESEKVTSKKTQRKVESDSDSEEEAKPKKVAKKSAKKEESSSDEEEKKPKKAEKKKTPKKVESSDDDESSDEEVKPKKVAPKKKSFSEDSDSEDEKPKKVSKKVTKKEESSSSSEEEEEKPKKGKVKKEESSDSEESSEEVIKKAKEKQSKKKPESDEDEKDNEEPELVKQEKPKEQPKKSYSSGTWNELFIKNLSYNTTDVGLAEYFSKYGDVEETKIVYDKESGRSKGVGFCRFYDAASAVKAMEDAGQMELDGRPISISYSNEKPTRNAKQTNTFKADSNYQGQRFGLFVGNLSFKSNEQGIENFFKDCGKIIDIRIAKTPEGKMKGFAHVDFDSAESVENALKKNGFKLDGRELRLDKSESKPRNGGNKGNFNKGGRGGASADPITKAKKSGAIIATESKAVALSDSDDE